MTSTTQTLKTDIAELLNIDYPIVLSGMSWISVPKLVAAVSNAGGLGILASGPLTPGETREAIREIRTLTDKPFGIGCTLLMPGAKENAQVAVEEKVPVVNFSLGKGEELTKAVHAYGGKVIATVTTVKHAVSAEKVGVDTLLVTGHEAAAHGGEVTSLVLVPAIADAVNIPVIAAGGFGDGRGLCAALALGASGIAMGSRFAVSAESPLHDKTKQAIIDKDQHDTVYSKNFDGIPARYMKTTNSVKRTRKPMPFLLAAWEATKAAKMVKQPVWKILMGLIVAPTKIKLLAYFGAATPRLKSATEQGDLSEGMQFIGQTQGLIHETKTVAEIIADIVEQYEQTKVKL